MKEKFLGSEFWERVRKGNLSSLNLYSPNVISAPTYIETIMAILKDAPELKKRLLFESSTPPNESAGEYGYPSQVVENDGVYTLKNTPVLASGTHAISLLRRPVNRKSMARLTDIDDPLTGSDCSFVNENDIALLKQHIRTPSPDPLNRSTHSNSRSSSRQSSPLAAKSSSFSFDRVDFGEPISSTTFSSTGGIAGTAGIASRPQPLTPSAILRNRPKPPRLNTNIALPPSRSASPSHLTTSSPTTSTTTTASETPVDGLSQEGGLSEVVLEATYLMKGLKILIIEDSTVQRKLMSKKLHKTGGGNGTNPNSTDGNISRRPSGTFNFEKNPSHDQIEGISIPVASSPGGPNLRNLTPPAVFNFLETSTASLITSNVIPRPPTPFDMSLTTDSTIDHVSVSPSYATINKSPASIQTSQLETSRDLDHGWQVSEAVNGEEAIKRLISTKETFDIIFVDENLQSTGGNLLGHEVVRILRGHHSVPASTIIIGCSSTADKNASLFLDVGANAVWKKPMPSDERIRTEICKYLAAI